MTKTLLAVVPIAIPALTFIAALFGPALRTAARLRRDLTSDGGFVDKLPEPEKGKLAEDMGRRALILIGYSRYPALVLTDILALASSIGAGVYFGALCVSFVRHGWEGDPGTVVFGFLFADAIMIGAFATFHRRWATRAGHRIRHLESEVSREQAVETTRLARIAWHFSSIPGFFATLFAPIGLAFAVVARYNMDARQGDPAWIPLAVAVVVVMIQLRLFTQWTRTELDIVIRDLLGSPTWFGTGNTQTKKKAVTASADEAGDPPAEAKS